MTLEKMELRLKELQSLKDQAVAHFNALSGQEVELRFHIDQAKAEIMARQVQVPIPPEVHVMNMHASAVEP